MSTIKVLKRKGTLEVLDIGKIHKAIYWATKGIEGVSVSDIELKSKLQLFDGISTSDIHDILVKTAADLISEETPNYDIVASRLDLINIRKKAYGSFEPPHFYDHFKYVASLDRYDSSLLNSYSQDEFNELNDYIVHDRDLNFAYAGMVQLRSKYLVQDRTTESIFETPQFAYMLIGMYLFANKPLNKRMKLVKLFYDLTSLFVISLPTPIMAGVRTKTRQFASCVLIEADDSLKSINAAASSVVEYISKRAGIGLLVGKIRGIGAKIRNGEASHTGIIPFIKYFKSAVKSCSQGALRGGAATVYYPVFHYEFENLIVLKNNRGVEENRERHLDYGVQLSKIFYERYKNDENITLFSYDDVPDLYNAFYEDIESFNSLYAKYEQRTDIRKKVISAKDMFHSILSERAQTGRIYIQNIDHSNTHSSFDEHVAPIKMSNLCVAPETMILTDNGYKQISTLENETVSVWNGEEFSETIVQKTGVNQQLLTVKFDNGVEIDCTPYHKFYIVDELNSTSKKLVEREVRAQDLKNNHKIIKFDLDVVNHGDEELLDAYVCGFYTGDGCLIKDSKSKKIKEQRIYLYHEKQNLLNEFVDHPYLTNIYEQPSENRTVLSFANDSLLSKYTVPSTNFTINSRLEWLAGILDSDGTVAKNGNHNSLQLSSANLKFLQNVQLMLQELGVHSRITLGAEASSKLMNKNKYGDKKLYNTQNVYRLFISHVNTLKLINLGLNLRRLIFNSNHTPNREASVYTRVVSVENKGRFDDTYCFNEPLNHRGIFNGIITGQCAEITLPTKSLKHVDDPDGEIALCTLSAFNLGTLDLSRPEEIEETAYVIVSALDELLDYQEYLLPAAEKNKLRRTLGVGVTNLAYYLAKNNVKYSDNSALQLMHDTMEAIQYNLIKASVELAKEKGKCELFNETKYSKGILPIDTYKKDVIDKLVAPNYKYDWEKLRQDVLTHGMRNSTLSALMPCETSSLVTNSTNGIEPVRSYVTTKSSKDGAYKIVVPDILNLKNNYELLWDIPDNTGYLNLVGILQKFIDQSISANTNYDPSRFEGNKIPMKVLVKDLFKSYSVGAKTLYYSNTRDDAHSDNDESGCASGACKL